jgi:hypothetical protein
MDIPGAYAPESLPGCGQFWNSRNSWRPWWPPGVNAKDGQPRPSDLRYTRTSLSPKSQMSHSLLTISHDSIRIAAAPAALMRIGPPALTWSQSRKGVKCRRCLLETSLGKRRRSCAVQVSADSPSFASVMARRSAKTRCKEYQNSMDTVSRYCVHTGFILS